MINIFGKLYTLLRRPKPGETEQAGSQEAGSSQEPEGKEMKDMAAADDSITTATGGNQDDPTPTPSNANDSGTCVDDKVQKTPQTIGNETMDLNEMKKLVDEMSGETNETKNLPETVDAVKPENLPGTVDNVKSGNLPETVDEVKSEDQKTEGIVDEGTSVDNGSPRDKGTSVDGDKEGRQKEGSAETPGKGSPKHADKKDKKVCSYFRRGKKCWKGPKCPFEHTRKGHSDSGHGDGLVAKQEEISESDFPCYSDYVAAMTANGRMVKAKDLLYKLGYIKGITTEAMGQAVKGQYNVAVTRNNWYWVKDARYYAELFFSADWIYEHLPTQGKAGKPRKSKPKKQWASESDWPRDECRDVRLKENPGMTVYTANAAGDGELMPSNNKPEGGDKSRVEGSTVNGHGAAGDHLDAMISDCTEQVLQDAMKQAIQDGLSESCIMEVIEDVTTVTTPRKRAAKLAKVDLNRTPKKRPEQLALGFNYHADVLVQQSPKTVKGGIICLDNHPVPREPVEQIAYGFNYHAEELVKASPVSASGEVLVPGVPNTPSRKAREHLAVGFNYHSDQLAQSTAEIDEDDIVIVNGVKTPKSGVKSPKPEHNKTDSNILKENVNQDVTENLIPRKSAKRSSNDMFAVGFSYNSNMMVKQSLGEVNENLPSADIVSSIIEDAQLNENRNTVEATVEDVPFARTPAGSVW